MLKILDWLDIADIVKEHSIIKSLAVLSTFHKEIKTEQVNDFIISIVPKMKNEDKKDILGSEDFIDLINNISDGTIWSYKNKKNTSLLKNILLSIKEEDDSFLSEQKEQKMEKIDNVLEKVIHFSTVKLLKENMSLDTIDNYKNKITLNTISLLIKLNMKKSLQKLVDKGFSIFNNDDEIKNISSVSILEMYIESGNTLEYNIVEKDELIPLWVFLFYKFKGYLTLSNNKKDLKDYIRDNISKELQRKEEIRRYWLKWNEENNNDPIEYFDSIEGWENLRTINQQNILLKLIEKRCSKINSLYRKKEFINHLKESDIDGKNIWGYLLGYKEGKLNKLSDKIIPYLKENGIYPEIDKTGKGLIRQSKAMLDIVNKSGIEKLILKTFDNTVWLGDYDEQKDFANELIEICLSMDKVRYIEYEFLISYIYNFTKMKDVHEELLFSIFVFYAFKDKINVDFENEISFIKISCPKLFIDKQDILINKIEIGSENTSSFVIPKLKEAKIYTKMMMKTISKDDIIIQDKNKINRI